MQSSHTDQLKKRMRMMLIIVGILFGGIFLYKLVMNLLLKHYMANLSQVVTVATMKVDYSEWEPQLKASGSLRAIRGVNVTTELAGLVRTIYFTPGAIVKEGDVLVQLNADTEIGQLQSLQAQAVLAKITYDRDQKQYKAQAISKQTLDSDYQNWQNLLGQVASQAATVAKKTIRAPFSGRLGINLVNPGQYINTGNSIVSLQTLDPIYADFFMPQQLLAQLHVGQPVVITTESYPGKTFAGTVTTINPAVDVDSRNVEVEATIANPTNELAPGMFISVTVNTGKPMRYLTLPQTAVTFNPYGDLVYVVTEDGKDKHGKSKLVANQVFVETGQLRGDQTTILRGLKAGQTVVTSGQLKLRNGVEVAINNAVMPSNNPAPIVPNNGE